MKSTILTKQRNRTNKSIATATTPSEVREALRDINKRTRNVQETNRRRLAKYGRKIRKK